MLTELQKRWALAIFGGVFLAANIVENLPGVHLPFHSLHFYHDWDMFTGPPKDYAVVVGTPKDGGQPVMLLNPADRSGSFFERWKNGRLRKLHEAMAKPATPNKVKQAYLESVCNEHKGTYKSAHIRMQLADGNPGAPIAERACE